MKTYTRDQIKHIEEQIPKPWFSTPLERWQLFEKEGAVRIYLHLEKSPRPSVTDPAKYQEVSDILTLIERKYAAREYAKKMENKHLEQVYEQSSSLPEPDKTL